MELPSLLKNNVISLRERKEDASLQVSHFLRKSVVFPFLKQKIIANPLTFGGRSFANPSQFLKKQLWFILTQYVDTTTGNHFTSLHNNFLYHKKGTKTLSYESSLTNPATFWRTFRYKSHSVSEEESVVSFNTKCKHKHCKSSHFDNQQLSFFIVRTEWKRFLITLYLPMKKNGSFSF